MGIGVELADALAATTAQLADVVRTADTTVPVPGLEWDVGDTAAHLIMETERFADFVAGIRTPEQDLDGISSDVAPERVAAVNRRLIGQVSDRHPPALADRLQSAVGRFLAEVDGRPEDAGFRSWEGTSDIATAAATLLAETLVHGHDVAGALARRSPVDGPRALLALRAVWELLPNYVDRSAVRDVRATIAIVPRGGEPVALHVDRGDVWVAQGAGRADCTIRIQPSALLLLAFDRLSLPRLVIRGHAVATGRRPWLALRVPSWFLAP